MRAERSNVSDRGAYVVQPSGPQTSPSGPRRRRDHLQRGLALGPGLTQHLGERLGRLGPGDPVAPVDDVERDAAHAVLVSLVDVGLHVTGVLVGGQHLLDPGRVETGGEPDLPQHRVVGHVADLGEVRRQQGLLEPVLHAGASGLQREVEQPVGVHGVGARGLVHPEDQPELGRDRLHLVDHPTSRLHTAAVLAAEVLVDRLGRVPGGPRVELVGVPDQLDVVGVREVGQGLLEAALPDVAPGADHVGPDVDAHAWHNPCAGVDVPRSVRGRP